MKKINNSKKNLQRNISNIKAKIDTKRSYQKKRKRKSRHIILSLIMVILIMIMILGLFGIIYIITSAPEFDTDKLYNTSSSILYDKNCNEIGRLGAENRQLVTYDELPQVLVDAIVATEDSRYFQHNGFDIARFAKASLGQLSGNSKAGGASTITMQVVGMAYTDRSESHGLAGIIRKFTDIYMAIFKIEKKYTKEEILEFYVNTPQLGGNNTYGIEQASQRFFGKSVRDISLPEAAILAGIFNAPFDYSPFASIEGCTKRKNIVLNLMYRHGYITEEQLNDAKNIPVESLINLNVNDGLNEYQWFIDTVQEDVKNTTGKNPALVPMKIYTTLDPAIQDELNKAGNTNTYNKWKNDDEQLAMVVTSVSDGSIAGIYGGRNQNGVQELNRATSEHYQPGSSAKPILDYGPAIEYNNASPGTYVFDEPMSYSNGQSIKNWDGSYYGQITMRYALAKSRNIPALQAFQSVDKDKIANFAHGMGINYGKDLYESYSIGSFDTVSAVKLSAAYATFARGGYYIEPYTFTKIEFTDTDDVYENKPKKEKVMSDSTAYMINSILTTAKSSYSVGGSFTVSGTDIAAKTGTSTYPNNAVAAAGIKATPSRDNWSLVYSPDYSISLWYGYDKLSKTTYTTMNNANRVKNNIMNNIGKKIFKKNSRFEKPSSIIEVEVEKETVPLQLPSAYTPSSMRMTEIFKKGTEPTETSIRYQQLENPTNGKATTNGSTIYLSWNGINTPDAINSEYLQKYFNDNYKYSPSKYYQNRLSYNNQYIGELRYSIYLQTGDKLQFIAETKDTNYIYQGDGGTNYTFVVKANYSIFKDNASSGLKIIAGTGGSSASGISLKISSKDECRSRITNNSYYNDNTTITATDINGNNITNDIKVLDSTITNIETNETVKRINLSLNGKYKITYNVSYNGKTYSISRTFTIADSCNITN